MPYIIKDLNKKKQWDKDLEEWYNIQQKQKKEWEERKSLYEKLMKPSRKPQEEQRSPIQKFDPSKIKKVFSSDDERKEHLQLLDLTMQELRKPISLVVTTLQTDDSGVRPVKVEKGVKKITRLT